MIYGSRSLGRTEQRHADAAARIIFSDGKTEFCSMCARPNGEGFSCRFSTTPEFEFLGHYLRDRIDTLAAATLLAEVIFKLGFSSPPEMEEWQKQQRIEAQRLRNLSKARIIKAIHKQSAERVAVHDSIIEAQKLAELEGRVIELKPKPCDSESAAARDWAHQLKVRNGPACAGENNSHNKLEENR